MSRKKSFDSSRRRFLGNSASGLAGAAIAVSAGKKSWYSWAEDQSQRRNLVCIHLQGGWDANWFHSAIATEAAPSGTANQAITRSAEGLITRYVHGYFTERTARSNLVPFSDHHTMGIGGQNALAAAGLDTASFMREVCLWKGVETAGLHDIPNYGILQGSQSQYAISFSSLFAESNARKYGRLPLNYVMATGNPTQFKAAWAMVKGDQTPINIANYETLLRVTQRSPNDLQGESYTDVNSLIRRLGEELGKEQLTLRRSQEIYKEFVSFFQGALTISALGSDPTRFLSKWVEYAETARAACLGLYASSFRSKVIANEAHCLLSEAGRDFNPMFTFTSRSTHNVSFGGMTVNSALSTPYTVANISGSHSGYKGRIASIAFGFALSDFLLHNNLTSVVDVPGAAGDYHGANDMDLLDSTVSYCMTAKLVKALRDSGLLAKTTVMMFSEFDRGARLNVEVSEDNRGTSHGFVTSILLAGYGVQRGKVIGDTLTTGAGNPFGNSILSAARSRYSMNSNDTHGPFGVGAPIDLATGTLSSSGVFPHYNHVFPTIMSVLGVEVPANQLTDFGPVAAVVKSE